jgi:hypothetical protein
MVKRPCFGDAALPKKPRFETAVSQAGRRERPGQDLSARLLHGEAM